MSPDDLQLMHNIFFVIVKGLLQLAARILEYVQYQGSNFQLLRFASSVWTGSFCLRPIAPGDPLSARGLMVSRFPQPSQRPPDSPTWLANQLNMP